MSDTSLRLARMTPFNSSVEAGLRALCMLAAAHPEAYDLQRLSIFDYLVVHSADLPGGPTSLHPPTPQRSGELLVRRRLVEDGLLLYVSRGLLDRRLDPSGFRFAANEWTASFLDSLTAGYTDHLRLRAEWVVDSFGSLDAEELDALVHENLGRWGAEFELSAARTEEAP
jgi:hypothetical protein